MGTPGQAAAAAAPGSLPMYNTHPGLAPAPGGSAAAFVTAGQPASGAAGMHGFGGTYPMMPEHGMAGYSGSLPAASCSSPTPLGAGPLGQNIPYPSLSGLPQGAAAGPSSGAEPAAFSAPAADKSQAGGMGAGVLNFQIYTMIRCPGCNEPGVDMMAMPCGHYMHSGCLMNFALNCPLCQQPVQQAYLAEPVNTMLPPSTPGTKAGGTGAYPKYHTFKLFRTIACFKFGLFKAPNPH
ncbi:unnamed protein product [Chrysoparadoxa australica]